MDEIIINEIIDNMPQLTTRELMKEYNEKAPIPFKSYNDFISQIANNYRDVYDKIMISKEQRSMKLELALQDAESALIANASLGDIKSIEFLLKTQKEEYRDRMRLDINATTSTSVSIISIVQDRLDRITSGQTIQPDNYIDAQIEDSNNGG